VSWMNREREVREMRDAKTVLTIIRERGKRGLPLERVYRLLYNPELYLKAYGKIYRNDGALTPGSTEETADGMSLAKIGAIIEALRRESYRWRPARRVYIEKQGSEKPRPLGLPTFSDKLLQEVIRLILMRRTTIPNSATDPTVSVRDEVAIRRSRRSNGRGRARLGSSRGTSPTASAVWITRYSSRSFRRRSTTAAF
jgi:hypothetical protein